MSAHGNTYYQAGLRRLTPRDPAESHRAASPLELFYDLTLVAAFAVAGSELAHGIVHAHAGPAIIAFSISVFAIIWAWTNYSWFASAFDNDDWLYRVLTLVQMAGVIIVAVGIPQVFESVIEGHHLNNNIVVAGYIVMRLGLVGQWLRVAKSSPKYRSFAKANVIVIGITQAGWTSTIFIVQHLSISMSLLLFAVLIVAEFARPIFVRWFGDRVGNVELPFNAHHIAERYSLLALITVGESVVGTLAAAQQISATHGWDFNTVSVLSVGVLMSFALWWTYFLLPSAPIIEVRRNLSTTWSYLHIAVFGSLAAVGAGLHTIGYAFDPEAHVSTLVITSALAVPTLIFVYLLTHLRMVMMNQKLWHPSYLVTYLSPALAIGAAALHVPLVVCLLLVLISPLMVVVLYEKGGHRVMSAQLDAVLARHSH